MRLLHLSVAACVLSLSASCLSQSAATPTLSVSANLVVVPVTVRDAKDHLIGTLSKDDFALTVDGKPQPIRYFDHEDDLPFTVGLLVDVSGSQRDVLDAERTASAAFLDGMLKGGRDRAFIVQFGHTADLLADITPSLPRLQAGLQKLDADADRPTFNNGAPGDSTGGTDNDGQGGSNSGGRSDSGGYGRHGGGGQRGTHGGGGTVLYDAVFLSSDEVLKKTPAKDGQTRKAIILLTDGDDRGSKESLTAAIEAAQRSDAALYAIYYKGEEPRGGGGYPGGRGGGGGFPGGRGGGFPGGGGGYPGGGRDRADGKKILERMADETGGRVYEVTKKMPLTDIYKEIAEELRSQYRVGFSPASTEDGFHRVDVDLPRQRKLILQARNGYYTGKAAQ